MRGERSSGRPYNFLNIAGSCLSGYITIRGYSSARYERYLDKATNGFGYTVLTTFRGKRATTMAVRH